MREQSEICVPAKGLLEKIDPAGIEGFSPNSVSHQIRKSVAALRRSGILVTFRKSNGERLICLRRVDRVDRSMMPLPETSSPSTCYQRFLALIGAPAKPSASGFAGERRKHGARELSTRSKRRMRSRFRRGQASRPAIRHAQFRGAAPYPVVDASFISFTPPPAAGSLTTLRLLSKRNPLRSRWQLCCLTDAAYPLRVLCWAFVC